MAYKNILVASNLAPESERVVDKAKLIADKAGARLSIVHIVEYSPVMFGGAEFALPLDGDIQASIQTRAQEALAKQAGRIGIAPDFQYLYQGEAVVDLLDLIKKLQIDLLVVGSHEHHGLGILFASVSNSLLHQMPCDICAVRV